VGIGQTRGRVDSRGAITGAGAVDEQRLVAAHDQLLKAKDLQLKFVAMPEPKVPEWAKALARLLESLAPVFKYIFWAGLAVVVLAILVLIGREIWRVRLARLGKKPKTGAAAETWRPDEGQARALLEDADRLAADGRFGEAVHLILYRSIEDLAGRKPGAVRPALTSRDIAGMDAMPPPARGAFGHIAQVVERTFFGGREIGQAEFADCRGAYERFAFAEGWS